MEAAQHEAEMMEDEGLLTDEQESYAWGAVILLAGIVAALFLAGVLNWQLPSIEQTTHVYQAVIGVLVGIFLIAAAVFLLIFGITRASALLIVLAVVILLLGVPLLGITVGLPPELQLLIDAGNVIIKILNAIISGISKAVGAFS